MRSGFADLQRRADQRDQLLEDYEGAVTESVREYHRNPSPAAHRAIARAVLKLRSLQGGRP